LPKKLTKGQPCCWGGKVKHGKKVFNTKSVLVRVKNCYQLKVKKRKVNRSTLNSGQKKGGDEKGGVIKEGLS